MAASGTPLAISSLRRHGVCETESTPRGSSWKQRILAFFVIYFGERLHSMKRPICSMAKGFLLVASAGLSCVARGDFELAAPDGQRVLLKDNGTWQYVNAKDKAQAGDQSNEALIVALEQKIKRGPLNCRYEIRLTNKLPYEVRIVLYYSAYRANGVLYDSISVGSGTMKPENTVTKEFEFVGISCEEIVRLQVSGGDRCEMGDLNKWSFEKGACLARVRVMESDLVKFEK
jgi:hypothetical protein